MHCAVLSLLLVCAAAVVVIAQQQQPFSIYLFDVGQGDSQLIVFPSGYSILVDCMESSTSSNAMAKKIADKIRNITGTSYVNVGVISHIHTDHIGMPFYGGMWSLVEQQGIIFGKIVDRTAAGWTDTNKDNKCTNTEFTYIYAGSVGTTCTNWVCWIRNPAYPKGFNIREPASVCSTTQIDPPDELAQVTITAADGIGAYTANGQPVAANHVSDSNPPNENDYSIGLLIKYGKLLYSTSGDMSGEYTGSYNEIEQAVAPRIGAVDIMKVNHHGSSHSSSQEWIDTLQPTVSLISVGASNTYGHPTQQTLDRLQNSGSDVYVTEKGNPSANYGDAVVANGDIVITSFDGTTYTVTPGTKTAATYTAKGITSPTCHV